MQGKLLLNGEEVTGSRSGFGDMRIRFGVNLTGSPALDRKILGNINKRLFLE